MKTTCESCGKIGDWQPKGQFDALCPDCGGKHPVTYSCANHPNGGRVAGLNGGKHTHNASRSVLVHMLCACGAKLTLDGALGSPCEAGDGYTSCNVINGTCAQCGKEAL